MIRIFFTLLVVGMCLGPRQAMATLGQLAQPGDNCSPINGAAIGYPLGTGQINDQRIILVKGWQPAGWLLHTSTSEWWFEPSLLFLGNRPTPETPPAVQVARPDLVTVGPAYAAAAQALGIVGPPALPDVGHMLLSSCFDHPWDGP